MSKTVRDVIIERLQHFECADEPVMLFDEAAADLVARLDDAGFVIVPKANLDRILAAVDAFDEQCHLAVRDGKIWGDVTEAQRAMIAAALQDI